MRNPSLLLLSVLLPLLLPTAAPSQHGVRLHTVPERVQLPAAPGTNLLLEVEVDGTPDAVWLATDAAATDRVALVAAGEHRYQVNLADAAVAALLPGGLDRGSFVVFARHGQRVEQSAAIGWTRATTDDSRVRCIVRAKDGATRTAAREQRTWIDPVRTERIEIEGAPARQSAAVARLAELEVPLARQADAGRWTLEVDDRLRTRLAREHSFEVELKQGASTVIFPFRCVPARLEPTEAPTFTVPQRKRAFVPGSNDWLEVRIDDITMGRVHFELVDATGQAVLASRIVHERDSFEFALADERYVIVVDKLHHVLIGEDLAEFSVRPAKGFRPDPIALLLAAIEASDDTFVREQNEYTGQQAAQFLRAKLLSHAGEPPGIDEFVDRFGSQSSKTGEPYRVKKKDGGVVTMREWLRAERGRIDAKNPPDRR